MARRERKVVTVLFADLVGFTARAESLDPEDVEAILRPYHERLRAELEALGGTVEKFIGDAVMAIFGAPTAHEDDPERAVRAALAIRAAASDEGFDVRIGVNTGEALVSIDADPRAGDAMAAGDVVNTGARLQAAAPVNGILVGEATRRATEDVIDYRGPEHVQAKGKAEPVLAWAAVEARSPFGVDVRQHGAAPLVGRERELDLLLAAFDRAVAERAPQLVTLVGVPGIGKSRLVWELFGELDGRPSTTRWRQGRCLSYGGGPFWALAEMVKAHAGILEDDSPDATAAKLAEAVAAVVPDDERAWVESHLRSLVGLESEQPRDRAEAFTAWRRFFEAVADGAPLVLVFEDLHWADEALLDFVDHLVDWAGGAPILVLCSARPELLEQRPGWGGGKLNALVLGLSPLGDTDTSALIAAALGRSVLPATTQATLLERAGGNPLYAEQFARLYRETSTTEELPEGVHGLIAARLDALSRAEKELLQDAAVHGKVFWAGAVAAMAERDVESLLHGLERKEFVRRERRAAVGGETEFAFRHVLVRDVAYGQIPRAERGAKHEAAARWIESLGRPEDHAELVAHHYVQALELARAAGVETDALVEQARGALREAGDRALSLGGFAAASEHFRRALELWPAGDPDRGKVLLGLGRALVNAGHGGEPELREAAAALAEHGQLELAAEAESVLGDFAWYAGDRATADAQCERALALVEPLPPSRSKALILSQAARLTMTAGRYDETLVYGRAALELADALDLPEVRASTLGSIGGARTAEGDLGGLEDAVEGLEIARRLNSPELSRALNNLGVIYDRYGRSADSEQATREAVEAAERFGLKPHALFARANLLRALSDRGRWDEVLEQADQILAETEAEGLHHAARIVLGLRSLIRLGRGDTEGADRDSAQTVELARRADEPQALMPALGNRAYVLAACSRTDEARRLASEHYALASETRFPLPQAAEIATVARLNGVDAWLELFRSRESVRLPGQAALVELLRGNADRAVELYDSFDANSDAALARVEAAKAHLAAGRPDEARAHIAGALEFFRAAGATRWVEETEALLPRHAGGAAATSS